ncbi:MAG: hypothetical protein AUH85_06795 [Chloroflexi bacterium 13_1_40CM_4_68_4]|nr:MAG: hypothetical protein AUH85_06795 [Chloroflexi bacterium 13_1_40CM_4_68_4]
MSGRIKTGVCGWTDKTLLESGWYPAEADDAESRLRFYASRFPLVENDATYYAVPAVRQSELWAARTPDDFTMNVKAFAPLTTQHTDPKRLPKDIRSEIPAEVLEKRRAYPKDLGQGVVAELARRFRAALEPLHASGKLGAVLFQYPPWFVISRENKDEILAAKELLPDFRLAVEFRNGTWLSERNREETLRFLRDNDLAYVSVDEPQGFPSSIPPIAAATSDLALVRFHGRNADTWRKQTETAAERFKYKYSDAELEEWVPRIEHLATESAEVQVLMNNCYSDFAVTNAKRMGELLAKKEVSL